MSTTPNGAPTCKCPAVCRDVASPKPKLRSATGRQDTRRQRANRPSTRSLPPWIVVFSLIGAASAVLVGVWGNMYAAVALLTVMSVGIVIYIASLPKNRGQQPDPSSDLREMEPEPMLQTLQHGASPVEPEARAGVPGAAQHDGATANGGETAASEGAPTEAPPSKMNGRGGT